MANATYLISEERLLYRDGLLQHEPQSDVDCRMCHECWLSVSKGKIAKFSPANGMWIGDIPDQLRGLTIPEQKLISLYRHNSCIIKLHSPWHSPSTAQSALKGNCITFPQNVSNIATSLPLSPNELCSSIKIIFIGSSKPSRYHLRKILTIRRQRILDALTWLKQNNMLYAHVPLDKHIIAALPENDIPECLWETLEFIDDAAGANAAREGYTEDPLVSDRTMQEQSTSDFIPVNLSGILDVNGTCVSSRDISKQMLHRLQVNSRKQFAELSEDNQVRAIILCLTSNFDLYVQDGDLFHVIPRGSEPSNEYNNPTLLLGLYPTLFPYGTGAFEDPSRPVKVSFKKQIQYLLCYRDRRFEENHSFMFIVFNMLQRREACLHARLRTSKPFFSNVANEITSINVKDIEQVLSDLEQNRTSSLGRNAQVNTLLSQVKAVGGKVMGSAQFRSALRTQIHALIFNQGLPSIFLTVNPADINSRVALYFAGVDLDLDAIIPKNLPSTYDRAEIIASHPVATAKFFNRLITTVLETMIEDQGVLGPVKAYFGTVESQGRGSLHLHMLIWLDHNYAPAELRERIKEEGFRNDLRDYLEDIISEDIDHL